MAGVSSSKMKEVHNLEVWRHSEFVDHRVPMHPDMLQPLGEDRPSGCAGLTKWTNLPGSSQWRPWAAVKKNTSHQISGGKKAEAPSMSRFHRGAWVCHAAQDEGRKKSTSAKVVVSDMFHFHGFQQLNNHLHLSYLVDLWGRTIHVLIY